MCARSPFHGHAHQREVHLLLAEGPRQVNHNQRTDGHLAEDGF
jgi:hypothetical protein